MRTSLLVALAFVPLTSCGNDAMQQPMGMYQCDNGLDDDGDGTIDFPDELGCISSSDDSEDSLPMAQCQDGRDNDGDGITDYPQEPGCFAPQQDDEIDDCPTGPNCPQCANTIDDDGNGSTDFPNDIGCTSASDTDEFTRNPTACGPQLAIKQLPGNNRDTGMFMPGATSNLTGACGGAGLEVAYELRITQPKVVVATTDNAGTTVDTVLYIRGEDCASAASEVTCNDNISASVTASTITASLTPGVYYLIVDARDTSSSGMYDLKVNFFVGEGIACQSGDDCGPGLVCRVPAGQSVKVCSKHVCEDGVDDDNDGKIDYPNDPGCSGFLDEDESDTCPAGPGCPECGDGIDNDGDTFTDFNATAGMGDSQCLSASSTSEACPSSEVVNVITTAMTPFVTTGTANDFPSSSGCGSPSSSGPDVAFRLELPAMQTFSANLTTSYDSVHKIFNSTCGGAPVRCSDSPTMTPLTNLAAGVYYLVVDGYSSTANGSGTINLAGTMAPNASCEGALAQGGVITCPAGYACKGAVGARVCGPALCNDGLDNDGDMKRDYPFDPGCDSPADDTEVDTCPGAGCPVCSNAMDDDADTLFDYPNDYGCAAASGTTELFCMPETDATALITMPVTTGTTTGAANDMVPTCRSTSTASDKTLALSLPVPVTTLSVDTIGSAFDTVLHIRETTCATEFGCDDDGASASLRSLITLSNVQAGNYAIVVDGYGSNNGAFTLNVRGTVAPNTACTSPLFTTGVLACPTGTTCQTGTCR